MKFYFLQVIFPKHSTHWGAVYLTKYDAGANVIACLQLDELPSEDQILAINNSHHAFQKSDGTIIAEGRIDHTDFQILEISFGDIINFDPDTYY